MKSIVARHVLVQGRVQGVAFRWHAHRRAHELGIRGWIRNLNDGRVEARIEGPAEAVRDMLAWLREGPPAARVGGVEASEVRPSGLGSFAIVPGGP